jgi:hypothetical protein
MNATPAPHVAETLHIGTSLTSNHANLPATFQGHNDQPAEPSQRTRTRPDMNCGKISPGVYWIGDMPPPTHSVCPDHPPLRYIEDPPSLQYGGGPSPRGGEAGGELFI